MAADESETLLDGGEQRLLAGGRHGGFGVGDDLREIAGGEKEDGLRGGKILWVKDVSLFGAVNFETVFLAEFSDDVFGDAELAVLALYYLVLKAGGFGKDE